MDKITDKIQEHRGADTGFRNKPENVARQCEQITHVRYGWTLDRNPIGFTPSRKLWKTADKRTFLTVNYRFKDDGTKIRIV